MIFSWLNTKAVDAFVDEQVADMLRRNPPAAATRKADDKLRKTHDQVLRRAVEFARAQRPNLYQKARLANRFKWALSDAGYADEFVKEFAYELAAVVGSATSDREV